MSYYNFDHTKIIGIAAAVPKQIKQFDNSILEVNQYHVATAEQTASDLGFAAAKKLLDANNINSEEIACIIFASLTPDYRSPVTAAVLQYRLSIPIDCIAYDLVVGATGFITGLQKTASILESVNKKYALLIVGDTNSKLLELDNPAGAYLGDGAGAVLLEKVQQTEALKIALHTYSNEWESFMHKPGGFRISEDILNVAEKVHANKAVLNKLEVDPQMMEKVLLDNAVDTINEFLNENELSIEDFNFVLFQPVSSSVLSDFSDRLKIDAEKMLSFFGMFGNTTGSSIPLGLAFQQNTMNDKEKKVLALSFGEGLSLGIVSFGIQASAIHPMIETDEVFDEGTVSHNF